VSQAGIISTTAGPVPPAVPTSFTTQNGTAVPVANNLIVNGFDSTENNNNGIITKGGVVGTGTQQEVDVVITNRLQGTGTTVGATTADLVTFSLGVTPGAYNVEAKVVGFNSSTPSSTGFTVIGTVRTTGAAGALDGTPDETPVESIALIASDVDFIISGNNLIIRVTGVAGLTINWNVVATYVFTS
jgi:hypothetical protein